MTSDTPPSAPPASPKSPTEKLAELVAQRKAAQGSHGGGIPGQKQTERAAAARSLSKSKPALRKS